MCYNTLMFFLAKIIPDVYARSWSTWIMDCIHGCTLTNTCIHTCGHTPESMHLLICTLLHSTQKSKTSPPPPSFHPQTLTCPLHLSVNQLVIPGVNHLLHWPAITACSHSEHQAPCCTLTWTPHPNHNALGLPPAFLQPYSFYLFSKVTTPAFMDSNRSITHSTLCTFSV